MKNPFSKFEKFGSICDFETRKVIAKTIFSKLLNGWEDEADSSTFFSTNNDMENFATTVDLILANPQLMEMTKNNPLLAEEITKSILDFIHRTKRNIAAFGNPYENEVKMADSFGSTEKSDFKYYWKMVKEFLGETYDKTIINPAFYTREFNKSLRASKEDIEYGEVKSYETVRDHLTDKWKSEIIIKLQQFQEEQMASALQQFQEQLNERIEYFQQMKEAMENMVTDFDQIFDMPKQGYSKENFDVLKKYHDLLEMNEAVKELVRMLGRMWQAEKDAEQITHGAATTKFDWVANHASKTDLIGIHESDDLNNLLPSETVLLSDPVLQTLFFKKFAEKKLQTFEFEDRVKAFEMDEYKAGNIKGKNLLKGPFIICVDTSGSMEGTPELLAKTICLAILKIALRENRDCYLITFSVGIVTLDLTDLKNNMDEIVEFLAMSFHGGTDASPALEEATRMLEKDEFKKADVLMISDFQMPYIQRPVMSKILKAKENGTKFHSLVIGHYFHNRDVVNGFDHNWHYNSNDQNSIFQLAKDLKKL